MIMNWNEYEFEFEIEKKAALNSLAMSFNLHFIS